MKQELWKTGNEFSSETAWEWSGSARATKLPISGTVVQEHVKQVTKKLRKSELMASNGWLEMFIDIELCLMKSVLKLAMFVKKL
jgi:hypothetical protein